MLIISDYEPTKLIRGAPITFLVPYGVVVTTEVDLMLAYGAPELTAAAAGGPSGIGLPSLDISLTTCITYGKHFHGFQSLAVIFLKISCKYDKYTCSCMKFFI